MDTTKFISRLQDFRLKEIPKVSFEFFPPKNDAMDQTLWSSIKSLAPLQPEFVSVTYGAGGSTRERTHNTISRILKETDLKPASHLTCIGASKDEIKEIAQQYWDMGVKHIVALRGDLPEGYVHPQDSYNYGYELVGALKKVADFEISVAAYPEKHPEAKSFADDIDNLKRKIDNGATRAITQYFFDCDHYFEFLNKLEQANIKIPIVPGILPITNFAQTVKFSKACDTSIPQWLYELFADLDVNSPSKALLSAYVAIEQCRILSSNGINQFHFYTLNRADLTLAICHILGIRNNI
jgi:methylenetetrahydrofolate reductase (NADPH)